MRKFWFFILTFFTFLSTSSYSQNDNLKLIRDDDGIKIFKEKDAHGNINRIVAITEIPSSIMSIVCLLKDFENHSNWVYANHGAHVIDSISPFTWIYYCITETPWPLSDRDLISRVKLSINEELQQVNIKSVGEPNLIPSSPDMIRIPMLISQWTITKVDDKHSKVILDVLVDAGGAVPQWIVNLASSSGPYKTIRNMKIELLKEKYTNPECGYQIIFQNF